MNPPPAKFWPEITLFMQKKNKALIQPLFLIRVVIIVLILSFKLLIFIYLSNEFLDPIEKPILGLIIITKRNLNEKKIQI